MNNFIKIFHSHNRNLILLLLSVVILFSILGLLLKKPWQKHQKIFNLLFLISMEIQFVLGLALYFIISDLGLKAFLNPAVNVMKEAAYRQIAVEHFILMFAAWIVMHIGYIKIKKSDNKNATVLIYYGITLVLILLGIPWSKIA